METLKQDQQSISEWWDCLSYITYHLVNLTPVGEGKKNDLRLVVGEGKMI